LRKTHRGKAVTSESGVVIMRIFLKHVRLEYRYCKVCSKDILHQVGWWKEEKDYFEQYHCLKCHEETDRKLKEKEVFTPEELGRKKCE
jgi:hypothetical protein